MLHVWRPSTLTRDQLEERRLYAQQLLATGEVSPRQIAETGLLTSRETVGVWAVHNWRPRVRLRWRVQEA
ncbi:hypothetical protein RDMS_08180 [Deinococcus sp. RL]|nr:hypothetical protein RDMS_08180 [Deinococcus sp. RL]